MRARSVGAGSADCRTFIMPMRDPASGRPVFK
jgi:hypothetical protein